VSASAGRHEPSRLAEEAGCIGPQLVEEIVDRLVQGFTEAEDAHVRDAQGHLIQVIDGLDVKTMVAEHRHEIVRPNEQHLLLAVMA